ncbi:SMP-30/gluconolactonase/LRE family protein [Aeoliella sp. SH292]|uniref:SMP-30/gluconolactonase/LRE family protein n=1 Tax=Aeoliella sp. SH292 TaxID=3454464 RepID=UPI003F9E6C6B
MTTTHWQARLALLLVAASFAFAPGACQAYEVLVADRADGGSPNVYRYNSNGVLLGSVIADTTGLSLPTGLALSPDGTKLYVSSSGNNSVLQYDYNVATGTATNPSVFADAADGLSQPSTIKFSPDGNTIYVSNLEPTQFAGGVSQFDLSGNPAGFPLFGGSIFSYSGLDFTAAGELVVGGFANANFEGGVLKSNGSLTGLNDLVAPTTTIAGAAGVAVDGDDVYVTGLFAGTIMKYDVNSGVQDFTFGVFTPNPADNPFFQGIAIAPEGNSLLVGILGQGNMGPLPSSIARYGFDGSFLGTFAAAGGGGFGEATAFITIIPEPASVVLLGGTLVGLLGWRLRRTA